MNKDLVKLANHLNSKGFHKEADYVDSILKKAAEEDSNEIVLFFPEEEFPFLKQRELKVVYLGSHPGYSPYIEWEFALNGEKVDFTSHDDSNAGDISDSLGDLIKEKLGIYSDYESDDSEFEEIISKQILPYIGNIQRQEDRHRYQFGTREVINMDQFFGVLLGVAQSGDKRIKTVYKDIMVELGIFCNEYVPQYKEIPDKKAYSSQKAYFLIKKEYEKARRNDSYRDEAFKKILYYIKSST
jgi:hypothetical protein